MLKRTALGLAALVLVGCASKPSENFLDQFSKLVATSQVPTLTLHLNRSLEVQEAPASANLRKAIEILANRMGFRVEASRIARKGWTPERTKYDFTSFQPQNLPGVAFIQDGDTVRLRPDVSRQVVVEWAKPPAEGFMAIPATQLHTARQNVELTEALLTGKDTGALDKADQMDSQARKAKAIRFDENVSRVIKDNGWSRAWVILVRRREASTIPSDSPFWEFAADLPTGNALPVVEADPSYRSFQAFFARKGQPDTKASLQLNAYVAFQDASGKCVKAEPWSAILPE